MALVAAAAGGQSDDRRKPDEKHFPGHCVNVTRHHKGGIQIAKEDQQNPAGTVHTQYVAGEEGKDKWEHKEIGTHSMDIKKLLAAKSGEDITVRGGGKSQQYKLAIRSVKLLRRS